MTAWLISGSRDFPSERLARGVMRSLFQHGDIVIQGGARGVDTWAYQEGVDLGCMVESWPAEWEKYGPSAGMRRNAEMLAYWEKLQVTKQALVLWDGESRGTRDMLNRLLKTLEKVILVQM